MNLRQWDQQHHIHPFTDRKDLNEKGTRIIKRAENIYIWDDQGNRLLDGMAGLWCVNVGYGRQELIDAAKQQMEQLAYYNNFFQCTTLPTTKLAKKIASLTPYDLNHVFFANSGSEANDSIIRMVRLYWKLLGNNKKTMIISRKNAYHGSTIAAASLGGMQFMHDQGGPLLPDIVHIDQPYWYKEGGSLNAHDFGLKVAGQIEQVIQEHGIDRIAAFIGEPIQGAGGVIIPPDSYWPEVQRICEHYGILLICDEVICGFGRTGKWFGAQSFNIKPDLMTLAKGLSSGYLPISAAVANDKVAEVLMSKAGEFAHGFTYSGHPVGAVVASENLRILEDEKLVEKAGGEIGEYFRSKLKAFEDHPLVGEVLVKGLVCGMVLVDDKSQRLGFANPGRIGEICRDLSIQNGLVMRASGDRMLLSPPLIITKVQIDEMIQKIAKTLDQTYGCADQAR